MFFQAVPTCVLGELSTLHSCLALKFSNSLQLANSQDGIRSRRSHSFSKQPTDKIPICNQRGQHLGALSTPCGLDVTILERSGHTNVPVRMSAVNTNDDGCTYNKTDKTTQKILRIVAHSTIEKAQICSCHLCEANHSAVSCLQSLVTPISTVLLCCVMSARPIITQTLRCHSAMSCL